MSGQHQELTSRRPRIRLRQGQKFGILSEKPSLRAKGPVWDSEDMSSNRPAIPIAVRREVLLEARHHCAACCNPLPLQQAHVIPWHESHEHSVANLVALCANCHSRADRERWGAKALREYKKNPCILARKSNAPEPSEAHLVELIEMLVQ